MEVHGNVPSLTKRGANALDHDQRVAILACQGCGQNVVVIEEKFVGGVAVRKGRNSGLVQWRGIHWWPTPGMQPADQDTPRAVADAVAEGTRCLAVRGPQAAVVTFRGALAEVVADRGSPAAQSKGSLAAQLKQMAAGQFESENWFGACVVADTNSVRGGPG